MAKIKNMGTATMKFNEGIIVSGSAGTDIYAVVVTGSLKASGNLYVADSAGMYVDKIRRYSDSDNTTKILLNDELIKLYAGHSSEDIVRIGDTNYGSDNNFWISGSIDSKGSATDRGTAVFGGDVVISGSLYARQRHMTTHKFNSTGTGKKYVKFDTTGQVGSPGVNNKFVVPARGLLESVTIRTTTAADSTDIALHKASDGDANVSTTATESITVDIASANTAYKAEFTSNAAFGEGEIVCISVNPTSAPNDVVLTAVWKFDFVN